MNKWVNGLFFAFPLEIKQKIIRGKFFLKNFWLFDLFIRIIVPSANTSNGAQLQYLLDEELQANFQEKSGMKMPIAKISFFVAEAEPAAE